METARPTSPKTQSLADVATLAGGCFWCTEAIFKMLKGVRSVLPGYAGGEKENPTYEEVSTGRTGQAEVIKIDYNPKEISLRSLLTVFFASHDPTTLNRQGPDVGTQYRSVILFSSSVQKEEALKFIEKLNASSKEGKPIVTEVKPLEKFYPAESYHKDYYTKNQDQFYCQVVINPKLEKAQKEFADLLAKNRPK